MTLAEFRAIHPDTGVLPDATVQGCLDSAARRVNEDVWGDTFDAGHEAFAWYLLSLTSWGSQSGLDPAAILSRFQQIEMTLVLVMGEL